MNAFYNLMERERDLKSEFGGSSGQWARCVTLVSLSAGDNTAFSTGGGLNDPFSLKNYAS